MDYSRDIYGKKINNLNLKIIGVDHRPKFLEKDRDFFKKEINSPEYLFFERGLEKNIFYQRLADLLDEQDKSIYVPDPLNRNHIKNDAVMGLAGLGLLTLSLKGFVKSLKKPISRRDFLKKSCIGLGGLYLSTGAFGFREDFLKHIVGKEGTLDTKIAYDAVLDFRNIICADTINRAAEELGFEGSATFFIGYKHVNGLKAYLDNPKMRKKRSLYSLQESFSDTRIKEYKNFDGIWKIIKRI